MLPLVLAFHGHGGNARTTDGQFHFNSMADEENFIVVYPDGIHRGWNDGRENNGNDDVDDVHFTSSLIDEIVARYGADPKRVFVTGMSNGAIFSIYLALKLPDKIQAIAPVCGSMPANLEKDFALPHPIPMLLINGTADPLIPYEGGPVVNERSHRGRVIGTEKLITDWLRFNGCAGNSVIERIPDVANDHCTATRFTYTQCGNGREVVLIRVEGGGHAWPGGMQYAPRFLIGEVCRDFDAERVIWDFFKKTAR